jgi:hypothetical protein
LRHWWERSFLGEGGAEKEVTERVVRRQEWEKRAKASRGFVEQDGVGGNEVGDGGEDRTEGVKWGRETSHLGDVRDLADT